MAGRERMLGGQASITGDGKHRSPAQGILHYASLDMGSVRKRVLDRQLDLSVYPVLGLSAHVLLAP
jgi:hypothetical protein